ncbi:MAG: GAF domain-containing protein [Mycolicibacterium rufum]|uniref:Acetoin dehydrogenase operon transcriptional activator AcoR n=1 Tax=Mycolicibacterium chlorophenolicum TaxID=37916 RepID=A0A0J6W0D0_9MYCO|nr:helix-turn-helix domain-containing protein [Mycolicibacterium chlorophenolicum]KMO76785.1 Acetoin dehydrogenase operon transcriptional activator AcoR [Mycolicibacterium chlorophenolicum]MBI5340029.1 GAF domain-containing protein [Mycolicibacterium rufum]
MPGSSVPEPAVAVGEDPRSYARLMSAVYDATMAGHRAPARPREVIGDSWQRLLASGIEPSDTPVVETGGLEALRRASGLMEVLDEISHGLESLVADGENILVVADAQGRVLWRSGSPGVLSNADRLGFVEGAHWGEGAVGTNAIGTALAAQRAVQVFSAEHFLRSHHAWTCAGAPIRDPRTGHVIGVVDVSGPAATVHPTTIALVDAVARLAESHLRSEHDRTLNRLRTVAAPILARMGTPALAVDTEGWVAAVDAMPLHNRILLPDQMGPGRVWLATLGPCAVEPLPGGWLVRLAKGDGLADDDNSPHVSQVTLDFADPDRPSLQLTGEFGCWRNDLSLRHAEILCALARSPQGRSAPQLAEDLYGDRSRVVTVRAEMSRLRKQFVGLLAAQPYRFASSVGLTVCYPEDRRALLPPSTAPAIRAARLGEDG